VIAKYFNYGKSKHGALEYLLNDRILDNTARVIKGNSNHTQAIINSISRKRKYSSGVLAFEEKNISEERKFRIMREFEEITFPGLDQDQYNILWVEHTDKNRLELNFVIPRIELTTGKAYNPHWYQKDQKKLLLFQDIINAKNNFTNPFAANKQQTLITKVKGLSAKGLKREQYKAEIHDIILERVQLGAIKSREEVLKFFDDAKIEYTTRKNSITIIREGGQKIRFQGIFYRSDYDGSRTAEEIKRGIEQEHTIRTRKELEDKSEELRRYLDYQARENREKYRPAISNYGKAHKSLTRDKRELRQGNTQAKRENGKIKQLRFTAGANNNFWYGSRWIWSYEPPYQAEKRRIVTTGATTGGKLDDRFGEETIGRVREERKERAETATNISANARGSIFRLSGEITSNFKEDLGDGFTAVIRKLDKLLEKLDSIIRELDKLISRAEEERREERELVPIIREIEQTDRSDGRRDRLLYQREQIEKENSPSRKNNFSFRP
jgi:hypothetical protein